MLNILGLIGRWIKNSIIASLQYQANFKYSLLSILHITQPFHTLAPSAPIYLHTVITNPSCLPIATLTYLHSFPRTPAVSNRIAGFTGIFSTVQFGNSVKLLFVEGKTNIFLNYKSISRLLKELRPLNFIIKLVFPF
jgi:hypothetical protein